jgi:two-component system, LytTR family, response regulator
MPQINGLDLIKSLEFPPKVIYTTSFPDFAVQGFELEAVDYLVKPFSFERFLKAMNRASKILADKVSPGSVEGMETGSDHFFIRSEQRYVRILFKDVLYVEALKDYVKVVTSGQSFLTALNLKVIEEQLPRDDFMRIHRSYIANLNRIEEIANTDVIVSGNSLPLGDSYREKLFNSVVAQRLIKR